MSGRVLSGVTLAALDILATAIRAARLRRGWTLRELAERVGVSEPTIIKVEQGSPTVAVGTVLEAATLVGVPLFDEDPDRRELYRAQRRAELALLPEAARPRRPIDDDF